MGIVIIDHEVRPTKTSNYAGRKSFNGKDEKEVVSKLEAAFLLGATDKEACICGGISRTSLFRYEQKNPQFRNRKLQLKAHPIMLARKTVVTGLQSDPHLAFKYLERKCPDEFDPHAKGYLEEKRASNCESPADYVDRLIEGAANES